MSEVIQLRKSTLKQEGALQSSKLLKIPVLLDINEMKNLLRDLEAFSGSLFIFSVQGVLKKGTAHLTSEIFLERYASYLSQLKQGLIENIRTNQGAFSAILSGSLDILYSISIADEKEIVKATQPVIQLQSHNFQFSKDELKFHSQVLGENSISWGIHFSYPQLYQDPKTKEILSVNVSEQFPNTALFRFLQRWMRQNTKPTSFNLEGNKVNSSIRLGKDCFSWINSHPQLIQHKITVNNFLEDGSAGI